MLELKNIYKTYRTNHGVTCRALTNVSLSFEETGLVFIVGKSGGGKSTLLNIIGALDTPDRGSIALYGNELSKLSRVKLDAYRNTFVGTVFQEYNLLPTLNAERNIALALGMQGIRRKKAAPRTDEALAQLKIEELRARRSNQLSGGQCQRVAIARALVKNPNIILADEPTGNLDTKTGAEVFEIFKQLSKEKLVIIVSHDRETADRIGDRVIEIKDGRVHKDIVRTDRAYASRVDLVGDRLIRVPKNTEVDERSLHDINEILFANDKDTYVINERDVEKVKSLNIHVKNSVDLSTREDELNYYPYTPVETPTKKIKFIRSRMPFSVGLKLSLSTFKYKRFRLVVTVLMLTLALLLSATLASFAKFDTDRALSKTLAADSAPNIALRKQTRYTADATVTDAELAAFASSVPVYTVAIPATPVSPDNTPSEQELYVSIFKNFSGIAEVTSLADAGLSVLFGSERAVGVNEVIISQDAANELARLGYFNDVSEIESLVGKQLNVFGRAVTIVGIFACDQSVVADMIEEISYNYGSKNEGELSMPVDNYRYLDSVSRFVSARENLTGLIFTDVGFADSVLLDNATLLTGQFKSVTGEIPDFNGLVAPTSDLALKRVVTADATLEEGYIIIDLRAYSLMFSRYIDFSKPKTFTNYTKTIIADLKKFNENSGTFTLDYPVSSDDVSRSVLYNGLKIKGVCLEGKTSNDGVIYVEDKIFEQYTGGYLIRNAMLVPLDGVLSHTMGVLEDARELGFGAVCYAGDEYGEFVLLLDSVSSVIFGILAALVLVSAALLFSFVSASIKLEKRQIGILRAMGARGFDTFKTFAIEGSLISLFSIGITAAVCAFVFPYLNKLISEGTYMAGFYLTINPRTALYMLATAAVITALGIIIPLVRLVRMTPVDTMNRDGNQR